MGKKSIGIVIGGKLNLHEKPVAHLKRLTLLPDGAQITVYDYDAQWYKAQYFRRRWHYV